MRLSANSKLFSELAFEVFLCLYFRVTRHFMLRMQRELSTSLNRFYHRQPLHGFVENMLLSSWPIVPNLSFGWTISNFFTLALPTTSRYVNELKEDTNYFLPSSALKGCTLNMKYPQWLSCKEITNSLETPGKAINCLMQCSSYTVYVTFKMPRWRTDEHARFLHTPSYLKSNNCLQDTRIVLNL